MEKGAWRIAEGVAAPTPATQPVSLQQDPLSQDSHFLRYFLLLEDPITFFSESAAAARPLDHYSLLVSPYKHGAGGGD